MGIDTQEYMSRYGRRPPAVRNAPPPFAIKPVGVEQALAGMDELASNLMDATVPAAAAGARVLYQRVHSNADLMGEGYPRQGTGRLKNAIYRVLSKDQSRPGHTVYHVSWNARKAPHGHLVENGHWQPYKIRRGRNGRFFVAVKPGMLKEFLRLYRNKPVPKNLRDKYFVRLPAPKWVPARPFVREAQSQFPQAQDAAAKVIDAAAQGQKLAA